MAFMNLAAEPALGILVQGRVVSFLFALGFFLTVYTMINRGRAGLTIPELRKLPGIEAIDEAIGRSTEMGRPVLFQCGQSDLREPQTISSFPVLAYASVMCARYDVRIIQVHRDPPVMAIGEEITRVSYLEAGRPDAFNPDDVRPAMGSTMSVQSVCMGIFAREQVGAVILWGAFWAESMSIIEAGAQAGAIQIGATANTHQIPFFVAGCDYSLIGEEMYCASAYLSKNPALCGTVVGQDMAKVLYFAVIVLGIIISTATGSTTHFLTTLLKN